MYADIKDVIGKRIKNINSNIIDIGVEQLRKEIDTAPSYGGTKVVLKEIKGRKGRIEVKDVLNKNKGLIVDIGKGFGTFQKMLDSIGEKKITLVISTDPKTYGWRPE